MKIVVRTPEQIARLSVMLLQMMAKNSERGLLVTFEPHRPPRTAPQNAKIHVLIAEFADATGHTQDEMKQVLKLSYWPKKEVQVGAALVAVPKSTAELSREEASAVIERILELAAEMGMTLSGAAI